MKDNLTWSILFVFFLGNTFLYVAAADQDLSGGNSKSLLNNYNIRSPDTQDKLKSEKTNKEISSKIVIDSLKDSSDSVEVNKESTLKDPLSKEDKVTGKVSSPVARELIDSRIGSSMQTKLPSTSMYGILDKYTQASKSSPIANLQNKSIWARHVKPPMERKTSVVLNSESEIQEKEGKK